MIRRTAIFMVTAAVLVAPACSKKQPPPQPTPQQTSTQPQAPPPRATGPDTVGDGARRMAAEAAETRRLRDVLEQMVFFDYDESRIRQDAEQALQSKLPILRSNQAVALQITGHADERGSTEYNLALGLRRANAVKDYLSGFGIDASRLTTQTMGEDRPLDMGHDSAAYARNRRAEFTVTRGGEKLVAGR